ncbi:MAG: hypothetical protein PHY59_03260 [Methanobacterium sp.]|nr:hypothetical protein [Methanobacterium sp.]
MRETQKKERSISGLSRVGDNFYGEVSNYLNRLMRKIDDNPLSFESYLLRDAQRIVAEICERREHKIANSAVMNVQRAYQLFKESKSKDSKDDNQITIPINSTPEEEGLYLELVDSFTKYREKLTAPLMSYIQKNHGNHSKKSTDKTFKSLKSLNIDEILSDVQTKALATENIDIIPSKDDFENQIFERFGSEPSRNKSENKIQTEKSINTDLKQDNKNISQTENNKEIPIISETNDSSDNHKETAGSQDNDMKTLLILDEFPSILGVDKNIYGPVSPQDLITIPEPNARILVKNKKGIFIQTYK